MVNVKKFKLLPTKRKQTNNFIFTYNGLELEGNAINGVDG